MDTSVRREKPDQLLYSSDSDDWKRILVFSIGLLIAVPLSIVAFSLWQLHQTNLTQRIETLQTKVRQQAKLIDAVSRWDREAGSVDSTTENLTRFNHLFSDRQGFGDTGEYVLGQQGKDGIEILSERRFKSGGDVPNLSNDAAPMKLALSGQSGWSISRDYRGITVLAAFAPIPELNAGLVAKVDMDEVNIPFRRAFYGAFLITLTSILVGCLFVVYRARPILRRTRESHQRFEVLLESGPDALIVMDQSGEIVLVNRKTESLFGYTRHELIGQPIKILIPDRLLKEHPNYLQTYFGEPVARPMGADWKLFGKAKSGQEFPLEVSLSPIEIGDSVLVASSLRDVSEQNKLQEDLRRINFQSDIAFELTGCGYWHVDYSDQEYYFQSSRAANILGEPIKEDGRYHLHDEWYSRLIDADPEAAERTTERYQGAIDDKYENYESTYPYKRPSDGQIVWVHAMGKIVRNDQNEIEFMYGVYQDITERVKAEQSIVAAEEKSRQLLDSAPDGMMITDKQGLITRVNQQFEVLFGYKKDEIVGKPIELLLPDRFRKNHVHKRDSYSSRPSVRSMGAGLDLYALRKDGTEFPVEISLSPIHTEDGLIVASSIRDVTERKRAEQELIEARGRAEAANQAKSDFLANMSHEIRTPMNGIMGMTELALETDLTKEQREFLRTIESSSESLLTVINDILDFSKIEAKKLELDPVDFDLRDRIGETLTTLALRAHTKGLELAFEVAAELPDRLFGDVQRIRQVLVNLIGNAIKFTEHGEIVLRIDQRSANNEGVTLRFQVSDTGIGLSADKIESIFRPFEQADVSTTRKYGGTGLGLAISSRLVELMGGRLTASSSLGKGSTFSFEIDLGFGKQGQVRGKSQSNKRLNGLRVLVVDDNQTNRLILSKMLQNWNMQPVVAEDAMSALQIIENAVEKPPIGLVLSDVNMPNMDGFELAERIVNLPDVQTPPIIMLTSAHRSGDAARCRELGLSAHLVKPARQSLLLDAISSAVGADVADEVVSIQPPPTTPQPSHSALNILLAEDNLVNQKFAVRALIKAGHTVEVANNGQEAVDAWKSKSFDILLMDIQMPVKDGYLATAEIRQIESASGRRTPIVAMTAHAMTGDREKCLDAGMDGYVTKPIKSIIMLAEISRVLESIDNQTPGIN